MSSLYTLRIFFLFILSWHFFSFISYTLLTYFLYLSLYSRALSLANLYALHFHSTHAHTPPNKTLLILEHKNYMYTLYKKFSFLTFYARYFSPFSFAFMCSVFSAHAHTLHYSNINTATRSYKSSRHADFDDS